MTDDAVLPSPTASLEPSIAEQPAESSEGAPRSTFSPTEFADLARIANKSVPSDRDTMRPKRTRLLSIRTESVTQPQPQPQLQPQPAPISNTSKTSSSSLFGADELRALASIAQPSSRLHPRPVPASVPVPRQATPPQQVGHIAIALSLLIVSRKRSMALQSTRFIAWLMRIKSNLNPLLMTPRTIPQASVLHFENKRHQDGALLRKPSCLIWKLLP